MTSQKNKSIIKLLFVIYLLFLVWIILFKSATSIEQIPSIDWVNLIPYSSSAYLNNQIDIQEMIGNVIIFIPYGVYISILWQEKSFLKQWGIIIITSLSLELIQLIFSIGVCDITDLIHNSFGGLIGILMFNLLQKIFKDRAYKVVQILLFLGTLFILFFTFILFVLNTNI